MSNYQIVNATAFLVAALALLAMSRIEVQILAEDGEQEYADFAFKAFGIVVRAAHHFFHHSANLRSKQSGIHA